LACRSAIDGELEPTRLAPRSNARPRKASAQRARKPADGIDHATPKAILIWEEFMPTLVGFGTFAVLLEEQISEKISRRILSGDQGMIVWWSMGPASCRAAQSRK
jgi:hypothetical protein